MHRILSIFNFRRWPWACVMCLGFFLVAEGLSRRFIDYLATQSDVVIRYKERLVTGKDSLPDEPNMIIMGDSRALGLHARELSRGLTERLGRRIVVYNYSFPNHGLRGYSLLLKKYLRYHPKPEIIVFYSSPIAITGTWNLDDRHDVDDRDLFRFISLYSLRECYDVLPPGIFVRALRLKMERLSVLVAYRARIRDLFQGLPEFRDEGRWIQRSFAQSGGGALIVRNKAPDIGEVLGSDYYRTDLYPDAEALTWIERFFAEAQDQGILVMVANAPLVNSIFEKRELSGANRRYRAVMEDFSRKFDHVVLTDPLIEGWGLSFFSDAHHLNREGFRRFSREQINVIARAVEAYSGQEGL